MKLFVQIFFYKVLGKFFLQLFCRIKVNKDHLQLSDSESFVIFSNHSSHLDVIVLMSELPITLMKKVHPIGAVDYFARNKWLKFFTEYVMNAVLVSRKIGRNMTDPLLEIQKLLDMSHSIIIFPEGTRGKADSISAFKPGIAHILKLNPHVNYLPVYIAGTGKVFPKGARMLRPNKIKINFGIPQKISSDENSVEQILKKLGDELNNLVV